MRTSAFCQQCNRNTLHEADPVNHVLHFLISFFLCGLWIPVWILLALKQSGGSGRCTMCGYQPSFRMGSVIGALAGVIVMGIALFFVCGGLLTLMSVSRDKARVAQQQAADQKFAEQDVTVAPEPPAAVAPAEKPEPAEMPMVAENPAVAPLVEDESDKVIPGLALVDVYGNLKGFDRSGPDGEAGNYFTTCRDDDSEGHLLTVSIAGTTPSNVRSFTATTAPLEGDGDAKAREFFGFLATIPYTGSTPAAAKEWVVANVGMDAAKDFGGVVIVLMNGKNGSKVRMMMVAALETARKDGLLADFPELRGNAPPVEKPESDPMPAAPMVDPEAAANELEAKKEAEKREQKAASRLKLARTPKDPATRKKWLGELIDDFPGTKAAAEAQKELDGP